MIYPSRALPFASTSPLAPGSSGSEIRLEIHPEDPPDLTSELDPDNPHIVASNKLSVVYRFKLLDESKEVALKLFVFHPNFDLAEKDEFVRKRRRELGIWRRLEQHPNIVPFLGTAKCKTIGSNDTCFISAWMQNGTLFEYMKRHDIILSSQDRVRLIKGSASGLEYLHARNIIHGDLHPANILIDENHNACLTDFGLSQTLSRGPDQLVYLYTDTVRPGAVLWAAPELLYPNLYENLHVDLKSKSIPQSDIYSLSSVMLFILSGKYPWQDRGDAEKNLKEFRNPPRPTRPMVIPDEVWCFFEQCWSPQDPGNRPSAEEVLSFCTERLEQLLQPTINIVLFGSRGSGKSTIINILSGESIAAALSGVDSRFAELPRWYQISDHEREYRLWDTTGRSPDLQLRKFYERAYAVLQNLASGVNLILLCAEKSTIPSALGHLYSFINDFLYQEKPPIAFIVTHHDPPDENWWERNAKDIAQRTTIPLESIPHTCITTNPTGQDQSRHALMSLLQSSVIIEPVLLRPDLLSHASASFNPTGYCGLSSPDAMALVEKFRGGVRPFNVILFGTTDAKVGSIVSLITGLPVAELGPKANRWSSRSRMISTGVDRFRVWDIICPDDIDKDIRERTLQGVSQLVCSAEREGGVDLLVFCKGPGKISPAELVLCRLFEAALCKERCPVAVIATRIESNHPTEKWQEENRKELVDVLGGESDVIDHVCLPPLVMDPKGNRLNKKRMEYRFSIETMLQECVSSRRVERPPLKTRLGNLSNFSLGTILKRRKTEESKKKCDIKNFMDLFGFSEEQSVELVEWLASCHMDVERS